MVQILAAIVASILVFIGMFASILLVAMIWALAYSFIALVFPETLGHFQMAVGLKDIAPWQFGMICGWVHAIFTKTQAVASVTSSN